MLSAKASPILRTLQIKSQEEILCIRPGRSWRHQLVAFMTRPDPVIWGIKGPQKEGTRLDQMVLRGVLTLL